MTGGTVMVLGPIGYNFGAGMTGGEAFVLDDDDGAAIRVNPQLVTVEVPSLEDLEKIRTLVEQHAQLTHSRKAAEVLAEWARASAHFLKIAPRTISASMPIPASIPAMVESLSSVP
jgi:glutamate synthase domain-containing protein 3